MSVKNKYSVRPIDSFQCREWFLYKHYAKRIPLIVYSFGLFNTANILQGVCAFSPPPRSMNEAEFVFKELRVETYELSRLVLNDGLEKNVTSFFVSSCIKLMPKYCVLVSYADKDQNHHGYIYQATNWIYTGMIKSHAPEYVIHGKRTHARTMSKRGITDNVSWAKTQENVDVIPPKTKFRYFYFKGTRKQIAQMKKELLFPIIPEYPKGENKCYDASYQPHVQQILF